MCARIIAPRAATISSAEVSSLIHIYAVGYMAHDDGRRRFFGYFNFFIAVMLLLVLANSYLASLCRLGGRRPRLVPVDRVLLRPSDRGDGRQQGVLRQPRR